MTRRPSRETRLQQCTTLEYILLGDLRDLLEEAEDATTHHWLMTVLDALLDTVPKEFAMREDGGYLTEVLERFPNWYDQVCALQKEKRSLFEKLRVLRQRLARHSSLEGIAEDVRTNLRDWMNRFVAHHRHERRLVQTAYTLEVGAGD
jgi:hypothetical protein